MPGEKNVETSELMTPGPVSDAPLELSERDMGKDSVPCDSFSSVSAVGDAMSGTKVVNQSSALEHGVYYPPTSCYDYCYPGYGSTFPLLDDKNSYNTAGGSYISDSTSLLYYLPGYGPYTTGFLAVDGKSTYVSSEYLQNPCSYGSEAFPCYSYDLTYSGSGSTGTSTRSGCVTGQSGTGKSNGYNISKTNTDESRRTSALPSNSKIQQSSNFSKSIHKIPPLKPLNNKLGSGFQSTGLEKGIGPVSKFSPFKNQNPDAFMRYGSVNYQSNGRVWKNNYKYKSRESLGRNVGAEASTELTRGPRSNMKNPKLPEVERAELAIETDKYNFHDFQIEYDNAKFYVIKSFSEDDVHKCIKYNVWSSTPNGNRKLDAAFHEADAQASQTGKKCPVFLFFSVNGSGQFVGVAEMIGQVDFSKNMDFWQLDKWTGFFPIKWHIIKDVPNTLLRHIILENNEDRSVTFSRDTQEIGLKQGLEMLSIFKSYSGRTSILNDFNFYENREKSLRAKRKAKPASQTNVFKNGGYKKHVEAGGGITGTGTSQSNPSSLISLAENLSLNSEPVESSI